MVTDIKQFHVLDFESRAKMNLPPEMRRKIGEVLVSLSFLMLEQLKEFFGQVQHMLVEFAKGRVLRVKRGDKVIVITSRKTLPQGAFQTILDECRKASI